jgi:hypothetical protein
MQGERKMGYFALCALILHETQMELFAHFVACALNGHALSFDLQKLNV